MPVTETARRVQTREALTVALWNATVGLLDGTLGRTYPLSNYADTTGTETTSAEAFARALTVISDVGVGTLELGTGTYSTNRSVDAVGMSYLKIEGQGMDLTTIAATAEIDGSDSATRNNLISFLNLSVTDPALYPTTLIVKDLTIDCSLQSASGIPVNAQAGYNLCGIEAQSCHQVIFRRVRFLNCYGNAAVMASINPATSASVQNPIIEDCIFEGCVRGVLPQYDISSTLVPITGSVIQIGAAEGGGIRRNQFLNCGGPATDTFNWTGGEISGNYIKGYSGIAPAIGQTVASIHSDFGMVGCSITDNILWNAGPIFLNGVMTGTLFNANTPTPGPQGCTVRGNIMIDTATAAFPTAPAVPASGTGSSQNVSGTQLYVETSGGTGLTTSVNGVSITSLSLGHFAVPNSGFITATYTAAPTWGVYAARSVATINPTSGTVGGVPQAPTSGSLVTNSNGRCVLKLVPTATRSGSAIYGLSLPPTSGVTVAISGTTLTGTGLRRQFFTVPNSAQVTVTWDVTALTNSLKTYYPGSPDLVFTGLSWYWYICDAYSTTPAVAASTVAVRNPLGVPVGATILTNRANISLVQTAPAGGVNATTALTGASNNQFVIPAGGTATLTYSSTAPTWSWVQLPNSAYSSIYFVGGSVGATLGTAADNVIEGNTITRPPGGFVTMYDGQRNAFHGNVVKDVGDWVASPVFTLFDSYDGASITAAGTGSNDNVITGNVLNETRTVKTSSAFYSDSTAASPVRNTGNRFGLNQLGTTSGSMVVLAPTSGYTRVNASGNFGPGALAGYLADTVIGTSPYTLTNPFFFDCDVYVSAGTVSAIAIDGQATGLTSGRFRVRHGGTITITHTGAPTAHWFVGT